ncbi:MAG: PhoX family phosphatase [Rhodanobacteraceae bacterium]|nr:PhoX family phosphatase [Rhodanobacteraceae bacterium]
MSTFHDDGVSNPSDNPSFDEIQQRARRREFLRGSVAVGAAVIGVPLLSARSLAQTVSPTYSQTPRVGFEPVPVSDADTLVVPRGYRADVLIAWGDPISDAAPPFRLDAGNTADEQALQWGMHNDGMHFFPFDEPRFSMPGRSTPSSRRGLLVCNHEYTDDGLLHPDGMRTWTAEKVRKSQAAHGVSVIELLFDGSSWRVQRSSPFARRITAYTPMAVAGPAAGHRLLRTAADPGGERILGTLNNCAHGYTPWGTYLACEENFNGYFVNAGSPSAEQRRYGIGPGAGYRWHEHDERFDAARHPNEPNRFGWVVEIDPFDPTATPVKRTALGRFKHEGAWVTLGADNRVVVYMGDDERFEYIYKYVSNRPYQPGVRGGTHRLLDDGVLYVARFNDDHGGEWLPLVWGENGLTPENGFADQGEVLVKARQAADRVGATRMDRPEWIAVNPRTRDVYCTLTNNDRRGNSGQPAADAANPRGQNVFGHIIRWAEDRQDASARRFRWELFAQCGDPTLENPARRGNLEGDAFGSPDGLWFDDRGILWVQTDISTSIVSRPSAERGDYRNIGNNQMLAYDPVDGEFKRFLTGPRGCEITGVISTPDLRTLFVNVQHPGEPASERNDPANPTAISSWPFGTRPRSATVVIRREDGGIIGT